jgi:arabinofuranan 3-O-arabinosyltransferase
MGTAPSTAPATAPGGGARAGRGVRVDRGWSLAGCSVAIAGVALAVVFLNDGAFLVDGRFEHLWAPGEFLRQQLRIWDDSGTLGGATPFFAPLQAMFLWSVQALGASPAISGRLLHAALLAVAGTGTAHVLALYRRRIGPEHVLAGLLAMLAPYPALFLVPSALFVSYATAPWLVVAVVRGLRGPRLWGWAAVPALAAWAAGTLNLAALAYAALPALVAGVFEVAAGRAALRRAAGLVAAATGLTVLVTLPALLQLRASQYAIVANLATTERPGIVSRTSSWSESLRGAGLWIFYRVERGGALARPEARVLLTSPFVITATLLLPALALAGLALVRTRARLLFGALLVAGVVLMVGAHETRAWAPLPGVFDRALEASITLRGFRTSYKAGAALALGVAVLAALAITDGTRRLVARRRWPLAAIGLAGVAAILAGATHMFWSGAVYDDSASLSLVPGRWHAAAAWLDAQPGEGRVLVLPGTTRARYEFGYAGDDILDGLLARPVVQAGFDPPGTGAAADLVHALDRLAASSSVRPGMLAPALRRLGIRFVVVRHDLAPSQQLPEPVDLASLRNDRDLAPVATFGHVRRDGEPVPAIEVYEVTGFPGVAHLLPASPELLLSGGGDAWPRLGARGLLERFGPVRYTAALERDELTEALERGAWLAITDTNRRRSVRLTSERRHVSHTLAEGETFDRPITALFDRPGAESVARHADAARVIGSRVEGRFRAGEVLKPALAVDGDPGTAWTVTAGPAAGRDWLRIELAEPRRLSSVRIRQLPAPARRITAVTVAVGDSAPQRYALEARDAELTIGPVDASAVTIGIAAVDGTPGLVGLAEIELPGVELDDRVRVPVDVTSRAAGDPALARALARAPTMFQFEPDRTYGGRLLELHLRRDFDVPAGRAFAVSGALVPRAEGSGGGAAAVSPGPRCRDDFLSIDGQPVPLRVERVAGELRVESCAPVPLDRGPHTLDTLPAARGLVEWLALTTLDPLPPRWSFDGGAQVLARSATSVRVRVETPRDAVLVAGPTADPGWRASGGLPGAGVVDTLAAWWVPAGTRQDVTISYAPQRWYAAAIALSALAVALCSVLLAIAAIDRRGRPAAFPRRAARGGLGDGAWWTAALAVAFVAGGPLAAVVALAVMPVARRNPRAAALLAAAAVVAIIPATLLEAPLVADGRHVQRFVDDRPLADLLGQAAVAAAIAALAGAARRRRPAAAP